MFSRFFNIVFFSIISLSSSLAQINDPVAVKGVLNLSQWNPEEEQKIELKGDWEFYWNEYIMPGQSTTDAMGYLKVPGLWNSATVNSEKLGGQGLASYRLLITGLEQGSALAIEIPGMYCSYELFLEGKKIANNGIPGTKKEESVPKWHPLLKEFTVQADTLELVIHVSNFFHQKGGISNHIKLGLAPFYKAEWATRKQAVLLLVIGLFLLPVLFLLIFFFYNRNSSALYFALLSLSWAFHTFFSGDLHIVNEYFPDMDWQYGLKIEYITLYATQTFGFLFINKMFRYDMDRLVVNIVMAIGGLFTLATLLTPTIIFSHFLTPFHIVALLSMVYIIIAIFGAILNSHVSAWLVAIGILVILLMLIYHLLSFQKFVPYQPFVLTIGFMVGFTLNSVGLLFRFSEHEREMEQSRTYLDFDPEDLPKEYNWYDKD